MEHVLNLIKFEGMTGIGPSLEAGYDIVLSGKDVYYFALAFIAPLEAQEYVYTHAGGGCLEGLVS
jgi:hypothetical protein